MNPLLGKCPVCSNALSVTRLQCGHCGTGIDGSFGLGRLQALTPEQVQFVETFMKCRGKIKDVEEELGVSYPTVVARLNEVVEAMGYEVGDVDLSDVDQYEFYEAQVLNPRRPGWPTAPTPPTLPTPPTPPTPPTTPTTPYIPGPHIRKSPGLTPEERQKIMNDWEAGKISADELNEKLRG
jgi:hypothetical protein